MLWQEPPYDWLEDDGALTAAQLALAHGAAAPWLDDRVYALLPYSAVLLTAVPAPAEPPAARATPRSAAAPRCGAVPLCETPTPLGCIRVHWVE